MPGPTYREFKVSRPLDGLVECVWVLSQSAEPAEATKAREIQRIPPDGCVELIFHLADSFEQVSGSQRVRQPPAMVVGVWTGAIALLAPSGFETVGVRMKPGAASAFLRGPLDALTDTVADAGVLWGRSATALHERLAETASIVERLPMIEAFLVAQIRREERPLSGPLERIAAAHGRASIADIARDAGISHRQLERAFRAHVGVSPKMFSRITRFQHALKHAAPDSAIAWADMAVRCGYADQSHLIRDFAQFAGETPAALVAAEPALADYFRRR